MSSVYENIEAGKYKNKLPYGRDKTIRDAYNDEEFRIKTELESDLAAWHGVESHPKRQKLWSIAWDMGHSAGYFEVVNYYDTLSELLT